MQTIVPDGKPETIIEQLKNLGVRFDGANMEYVPIVLSANLDAAAKSSNTDFIAAVHLLRAAQKAYFRDRKQSDLIASKQSERDVDDRLARLQRRTNEHTANKAQARLL